MKTRIISTISLAAALSLMAVIPAFAQAGDDSSAPDTSNTAAAVNSMPGASDTGTARMMRMGSSTRMANIEQRIQNGQNQAVKEITARIDSLNKLSARIQSMKNLSSSEIASFQSAIQSAIADMTGLQTKIQSDTSTTSLMTDLKSIAPDYRIYILVEPQVSILSAADRVNTIVGTLTALETKIQARLSGATGISNLSALQADLTDMTAKLADATTQAAAASAEVSGLVPDNGDKTVMASNTAALKDARSKIQAAIKDIQGAYKDAKIIVQGVKGTHQTAPASTTPAMTEPVSTTTRQ